MFLIKTTRDILLLLTIAYLLGGCENTEQELEVFTRKKMGVDEAANIETFFSQGGKVKAKLTSAIMYRYQDTLPRIEFPDKLHVDFYNDSLLVESVLDAKYGRYIEGQNKMYLRDSVVVIQKFNQDTLRCEELWWDQNKERFYSDKPIKVTKKDGTVMPGLGLIASQDFKDIQILNPSNGILPFKESEFSGPSLPDDTTVSKNGDSTQPRAIDSSKTPIPQAKPQPE